MREYLGKVVEVHVDRQLGNRHPKHGFIYPVNYGFLPGTVSGDGEEIDAYILGVFEPLEYFKGKVIAVIHRKNDVEDKLVVAPDTKSYTAEQIAALTEFVERAFDTEIICL